LARQPSGIHFAVIKVPFLPPFRARPPHIRRRGGHFNQAPGDPKLTTKSGEIWDPADGWAATLYRLRLLNFIEAAANRP
jgi:hypothetical protein